MLKAKDIDELIATLQAARSGERAGPGKDHDDKVGAIVAQLQQLKDGLSQHDDGVPEQRLAKRIAASDALYASPYDFLAPRQASDPAQEQRRVQVLQQLGLDAGHGHDPGDLARAHRRQMHANILAAIQAYMDLGDRPVGDGRSKFADLLANREGLEAHFQRIHREQKVLAQIAVWEGTRPDDPITAGERAWLVAKLTGAKDVPAAPAKERAAALEKEIKAKRAASKITEDLETVRRRLVIVREAFRLHRLDAAHPGTAELPGRLPTAHANVMRAAIRTTSGSPAVVHYNTTGAPGDAVNVQGHDRRFTIDYDGSPDSVVGLYLTERAGDGPDAVRTYRCTSKGSGSSYARVDAGSLSRADRSECTRIIRVLVTGEDGHPSRIVSAAKHERIMLWLDDRIADLRRAAFGLPETKYNRDHPDRFVKEIRALGDASRHVEEQLSLWEGQVNLLKDLYVHLMALPPTKAKDAARYKTELCACLGPILTNRGFGTRAQTDLQALIQAELHVAHPSPRALGEALTYCSTHPELPAEHPNRALQQALAGVSTDTAELWWAKAKLMVETELLELSYMTRMARGDLAVRPEVDWSEISKLVEQRMRAANGLICYVQDFEGAYAKIEKIVGWLVGSLNNPDSKVRKDYPAVGDATVSLSVGLTAGGSLLSFVKLGVSLVVQISGSVTQEDDRRLRFKGSISLGLKATASVNLLAAAGASAPKGMAFGDTSSEHTAAELDWLNMKMGLALDKGLASLSGAYVYAGPEHMAAAWAHRVAMFQTYVAAAVAWIPMPGLRNGRGTRRLQVLDPRELADDEAKMLKLVAGGDTGKLLAQLGKPIIGTRSWRGPLHARDIGLAFDLQLPMPATNTRAHGEKFRQKKLEISFWRHCYANQQHTVDQWSLRRRPGQQGELPMNPAITRNWSKSYPPAVTFALSGTVSQVSTEEAGAGLFNVLPQLAPGAASATVASLGFSSDACPAIDLTFIDVDNHPNPDNDGKYINVKAGRKSTLSAGTDMLGPSVGVSVAWTKGKTINPREAALRMERLRGFSAGIPFDDGLEGARAFVPQHLRAGEHMPALEQLAEYGTFELNLAYSATSRSPRWEVQYGRIWRGVDASLSVGVPVVPGVSVDVTGNLALNRGRHEILGLETLTYVQTVYDGVTNRQRGAEHWAAYRTVHRAELLALCANVGRDGATSPYGHNNAHEEVRDDSEAKPARTLTDGPGKQAHAAVKAKATALLQACREPVYAPNLFGDEAGEWAALVAAATPKDKQKLAVAREVGNRIAWPSVRALSLRVVDDVTYAQSQVWPDRSDRLPAEAGTPVRFFFINPLRACEIHCAIDRAGNAAKVELEIVDKGGAVVWTKELQPEPVAAPSVDPAPPPPLPPQDGGVASLEQLHADEPEDHERRTPSLAVIPPRSPITHTAVVRLEPGQAPLSTLTHAAGPYKVRMRVEPRPGVRSRRPATWAYVWTLQPNEVEGPLDEYFAAKKAWTVVQQKSAWAGGSHHSALAAVFFEDDEAIEAPSLRVRDDGSDASSMLPPPRPPEEPPMPVVKAKGDGDCFFYGVAYWAELDEQARGRYAAGHVFPMVGDAHGDREAMLRARTKVADHLARTLFREVASHADLRRDPAPASIDGFAQHDYVQRFKQQYLGDGALANARMLERAEAQGEALARLVRTMILDLPRACPDGGQQWGDLMLLAPATAAAYGRPLHAYRPDDARYLASALPADRNFQLVPNHGRHGVGLPGAPILLLFNNRNHFDVLTAAP